MLLIGTNNVIAMAGNYLIGNGNNVHVLNLSSADLRVKPSSLFYVPKSSTEDFEYDVEYANYIFQNTQQRIEFLYMIHQLQIGNHVLIMIGTYPGMYEMAESLLKLVQSRYGYNGYFIDFPDLENLQFEGLDMYEARFSVPGLLLFDQEKIELDEIFLEEEKRKPKWL